MNGDAKTSEPERIALHMADLAIINWLRNTSTPSTEHNIAEPGSSSINMNSQPEDMWSQPLTKMRPDRSGPRRAKSLVIRTARDSSPSLPWSEPRQMSY